MRASEVAKETTSAATIKKIRLTLESIEDDLADGDRQLTEAFLNILHDHVDILRETIWQGR